MTLTLINVIIWLINYEIIGYVNSFLPVPMAARCKALVYGGSPTEIVGSNPTGGMDVFCECYVLSGRGLCDGLIYRPEEFYRMWRVE